MWNGRMQFGLAGRCQGTSAKSVRHSFQTTKHVISQLRPVLASLSAAYVYGTLAGISMYADMREFVS